MLASFLSIFFLINLTIIDGSAALILKTSSRQYSQKSYSPINALLAQYNTNSKLQCVARCARFVSNESLMNANLVYNAKATIVGFGRNISMQGCLLSKMTALSSYNLITLDDLSIGSGVQGRTIICGSLVSTNPTDFAKTIDPNGFPLANASLEINNNIGFGSSVQVLAGSLTLGTSSSHTITSTNNISYVVDGRTVLIQTGNYGASVKTDANLSNKCAAIDNDIKALSDQLSNLTNTSGNNISIPSVFFVAPLIFYVNNVDANDIAVFYIDGSTALGNPYAQAIRIIVNGAVMSTVQLVVINILGSTISFSHSNMDGTWLSSTTGKSKTIWNFNEATSISSIQNFMGGVLAPYAAVSATTNIDGMTAVKSLSTLAEVRDPPIASLSCP